MNFSPTFRISKPYCISNETSLSWINENKVWHHDDEDDDDLDDDDVYVNDDDDDNNDDDVDVDDDDDHTLMRMTMKMMMCDNEGPTWSSSKYQCACHIGAPWPNFHKRYVHLMSSKNIFLQFIHLIS